MKTGMNKPALGESMQQGSSKAVLLSVPPPQAPAQFKDTPAGGLER